MDQEKPVLWSDSWTMFIVVPRRELFHPRGGEGGPDLSTLGSKRTTMTSKGKPIRDNWKTTASEDGPSPGELLVGKCIFYKTWDEATNPAEIIQVGRKSELPGGLGRQIGTGYNGRDG